MLPRTADHLFGMARYMERAGQAVFRPAAMPEYGARASAQAVFSATTGVSDAV
jgi:hypothetical protein